MRHSARHTRAGTSPGTLIPLPDAAPPIVRAFSFGPESFAEFDRLDDAIEARGKRAVLWINVDGLGDLQVLQKLGAAFGLHELALEDVLALHHRAKIDRYEEYLFVLLRMPETSAEGRIETDQISIFTGKDFVISFQHEHGDCFDVIRERIRSGKGRIRTYGSVYLFHALIDAIIDSYYPVLERVGERLEALEDTVLTDRRASLTSDIHRVRRDLLVLRRAIWPLREVLNDVLRDEDVDGKVLPFIRDCYDHVVELVDLIETYRDLAAGLMEVYVSAVGNRMNQIMKVLTIIGAIFLPLSFIASVYGMNFNTAASPYNMPELNWRYGYPACLALMSIVMLVMLVLFWRRGWIGTSSTSLDE